MTTDLVESADYGDESKQNLNSPGNISSNVDMSNQSITSTSNRVKTPSNEYAAVVTPMIKPNSEISTLSESPEDILPIDTPFGLTGAQAMELHRLAKNIKLSLAMVSMKKVERSLDKEYDTSDEDSEEEKGLL